MADLLNAEFVEADAFMLLMKIMKRVYSLYAPSVGSTNSSGVVSGGKSVPGGRRRESGGGVLMDKLSKIQHQIVKSYDVELWGHLHKLGVEPHMYLIRWKRLIFAREYEFTQLQTLWDALFAMSLSTPDKHEFILMEPLCAAMLIYIREDILKLVSLLHLLVTLNLHAIIIR